MSDGWRWAGEQATREQWEAQVLKAVNRRQGDGLTLDEAMRHLTTKTLDDLTVEPLYTKTEGCPAGESAHPTAGEDAETAAPWVIEQLHEDPDVGRTAGAIRDDLAGGGGGVWLRVDADAITPAEVPRVLEGIDLSSRHVAVSSITKQKAAAKRLLALADQGFVRAGNLGIDPIGAVVVLGRSADLSSLGHWVARAGATRGLRALAVDTTPYDDAGVGDVGQLAYAIATGIEYVRALDWQGVEPATAFGQILFRVTATADQFATICRLRALRRLWARVGEGLGVPKNERGAVQHLVTSWRIMSRVDPWVNLLRATVTAFAGAVGGAQIVTTLPHDTVFGLPDSRSRRLARNLQLLVAEESRIATVADPAGGSWYVESLAEQMAQAAWDLVRQIEDDGGMAKIIEEGMLAPQIASDAARRADAIAAGRLPITGVSTFPITGEQPLTVIPRPARPVFHGLPRRRDEEVFEASRDRTPDEAEAQP